MAGFDVVAGVDFDPAARATFQANHPDARTSGLDIRELRKADFLELCSGSRPDVVIGGPSCQGFSTHGKRDPEDPRNFLFREFLRVVAELRPTVAVMENVKGLLTYGNGAFRDYILRGFGRLGYRTDSRVLLAADYGVPQLRQRLFFVARREGASSFSFPEPTHFAADGLSFGRQHVSVADAISDLPALGRGGGAASTLYPTEAQTEFQRWARKGSRELTLHFGKPVSANALSIIRRIRPGNGIRSIPPAELPRRFRVMRTISTGALRRDCTTLYYRIHPDRPAYTITCYFRNVSAGPFVHPKENRALTPREAARLQSFPDRYAFVGGNVARQIGNAVPPLLARAVAGSVLASLRRDRRPQTLVS